MSDLWSRRLLQAVELAAFPERFERGGGYARAGRVRRLEISPGMVSAEVTGSRRRAYEVALDLDRWDEEEWAAVVPPLAARPALVRRLLAGDLPPEAEEVLAGAGIDLLAEEELAEPAWWCTCPDWEAACKHVVAAWHAVAGRIDADPLVLLELRGCDREAFLDRLDALAAVLPAAGEHDTAAPDRETNRKPAGSGPGAPVDPTAFWGTAPTDHPSVLDEPAAAEPAALLDQFAPTPPSVRGRPLAELLVTAYEHITAHAAQLVADATGQERSAD